jgi:CRP-like cAMP-binding protein/L-ascorbate metabolism protein UlaG (beta-lactamase superfamily)
MLAPVQADVPLRHAVIEELHRRVKLTEVVLRYLGLQEHGVDLQQPALWLVSPTREPDVWREALLQQDSDCPIGFVINTRDHGKITLVHTVFQQLTPAQQECIRQYVTLAMRGQAHARILRELSHLQGGSERVAAIMQDIRRRVHGLDPAVLFSPDGGLRVQVGSLSQTTKNILREGIIGDYLFILPKYLFEGKTNYADVEFMVYLNFFVRQGKRTRIAGTERQREALERLLRLTIFGLFAPHTATLPTCAELQTRYGVPDHDTYTLFTMLYDNYSVRQGFQATGPILDLEAYLDFVVLHDDGHPTLIDTYRDQNGLLVPSPYSVEVLAAKQGSFEVSITQPDDRSATKVLEVHRPARVHKLIPEDLSQAIRFATHRPRFGITPLGTSHGFDLHGDLTCFVIWLNGQGIVVDPSPEALACLDQIGVAPLDLPYVFLTHVHADHDGGLIEKLLGGNRTAILASDVVFRLFIEKATLVTGHDFERERLVEHVPVNPGQSVALDMAGTVVSLTTRWNMHPIPTNGFILTFSGHAFGYSGDTQYDPDMLEHLQQEGKLTPTQYEHLRYFFWAPDGTLKVDMLYHEAGIPPIHTDKQKLAALPETVKAKTYLVHVADRDVPPGFTPAKPPLFATQVLLPATAQSRTQTLLQTLHLVSYLYDAPAEVLEHLLTLAVVRVFEPDTTIIHMGQVPRGMLLAFYVVTDGQAVVKDGDRIISHLTKADTFGEWGISHQRGFRVADVVTHRPTQVLEFNEEAYYWMVEAHPPVQRRIGRIRDLLPKLQVVRDRARQKSAQDPLRTHSVIEDMRSGQLAAFAVFSEVKRFQRWDKVVVEGEKAEGFYILLSGHLTVSRDSAVIGELSEADVFGEVGLLGGGIRLATVEVASADADILFMSHHNFNTLLEHVPVFSFGVRATAAGYSERRD